MRRTHVLPLIVLLAVALIAGCTASGAPAWTFPPKGAEGAAARSPAAAGALPSAAATAADAIVAVAGAVEITAFDLGFTPKMPMVPAAGRYSVTLKNTGTVPHDLTFPDGKTTGPVDAGKSASVEVDVPAGGLTFLCSVPGQATADRRRIQAPSSPIPQHRSTRPTTRLLPRSSTGRRTTSTLSSRRCR